MKHNYRNTRNEILSFSYWQMPITSLLIVRFWWFLYQNICFEGCRIHCNRSRLYKMHIYEVTEGRGWLYFLNFQNLAKFSIRCMTAFLKKSRSRAFKWGIVCKDPINIKEVTLNQSLNIILKIFSFYFKFDHFIQNDQI